MKLSRASWIPRPSKTTFLFFFFAELSAMRIELKFRSVTTLVQESKAMPPKGVRIYRAAFHVLAWLREFQGRFEGKLAGLNCSFFHPHIVGIALCSYCLLGQKSMFYFVTDMNSRFEKSISMDSIYMQYRICKYKNWKILYDNNRNGFTCHTHVYPIKSILWQQYISNF